MRKTQLKTASPAGSAQFNTGRKWLQSGFLFVALAFMLAMFGTQSVQAQITPGPPGALPPAGASIGNQAAATYTDGTGTDRIATSNTVITIVQQVASLTLESNRVKLGAPGSPVYFPHVVTNTGNGPDSYNLGATNNGTGDDFNLDNLRIYPDVNGDGVPDSFNEITVTPTLAPGEKFSFVVGGIVPTTPTSPTAGQEADVTVTATSNHTPSQTRTNDDTVTITDYAILEVTKSINTNIGSSSPTGSEHTYTLTYTNRGRAAATNVRFADTLNSRLTYVTASGEWNGVPLTDAAGGDPAGITYERTGQNVNATITSIAPGASGTISFDVRVNTNVAPGVIPNTAYFLYNDGNIEVPSRPTNTVELRIDPNVAVSGTGDSVDEAPQGGIVEFENVFTNNGTGTDTFDVTIEPGNTFPTGTSFLLFRSDGSTPLLDSNGNTIPDTGPLAAGASYTVVLKAILPPGEFGDNGGAGFRVQKRATSITNPTVSTVVDDTLGEIVRSTVDLDNGVELGEGQGPETAPVTTLTGVPGQTLNFTLRVTNGGLLPDNYNLTAGSNTLLAPFTNGFSVVFRSIPANGVITNTGNIAPGATVTLSAQVTIPANMTPEPSPGVSVYFRAQSPNTGALDVKHDAVIVDRVRAISIEPDHSGQTYAGSSIVYAHTVTNNGNAAETVTLSTADSFAGFTSVMYWDQNDNGILDPSDPQITSSFNLPVGGSRDIFVKVYAPANAVPGNIDVTTITAATADSGPSDTATDTTSIVTGQLTMLKEQALDANLDGAPDGGVGAYTTGNLQALPSQGIRYRITVTNNSMLPVKNVVVNDTTPAFTTYHQGANNLSANGVAVFTTNGGTSFTAGSPVPTHNSAGVLGFNIGDLNPGQTAIIYFGVRLHGPTP